MIRLAEICDKEIIKNIYKNAKIFMRENGNSGQWSGNYPSDEMIERDIKNKNCYVYEQDNEIVAVFCLFMGPDPTYAKIYNGAWPNDDDYYVIHRIAVAQHGKGIAGKCFEYGINQNGTLRIDTHKDNIPMQNSLAKNGFTKCGIIYLSTGNERIAYCKTKKKIPT